jgi:hypothetical protein
MFIFKLGRHIDVFYRCKKLKAEKRHTHADKYRGTVNDLNYDSGCMLNIPSNLGLEENFRCFIFVAQNMPCILVSELQWETLIWLNCC